jgi:hypothetical protein
MYSRSRLTRYSTYTSSIPSIWYCEIAKWNCQLSHLPASQHEWLTVSLLPRHKHWDHHRITGGLHTSPRACTWREEDSDFLIVKSQVRGISSKLWHVSLLNRVPCRHINKTRYTQNVSHKQMQIMSHQNHVHKIGIHSAVSSVQNVGIDPNDVFLSVSFRVE